MWAFLNSEGLKILMLQRLVPISLSTSAHHQSAKMRLSFRCYSSWIIFIQVLFQRFAHISAIFRHTYVDITPTEGLSVPAYQRHVLICKASYRGEAPDVEWFRNTVVRLENDPRFVIQVTYDSYETVVTSRLIFKNPLPSDSGKYSCALVPSAVGVAEVDVKFWSAPVLNPPPDVTIRPGAEQTITCNIQGGFDGTLMWLKDGRFVGSEGSFDTDGDREPDVRILPQSRSLTFLNAQASDAGVYSCRFRYNQGRQWKSLSGSLNVFAGVELKSDSYILWQGNQTKPLRVKCLATGYPLPRVSWSYTSQKINLQTGAWNGIISIYDTQLTQVIKQSTMTIAQMPGFFNITKFNCKGENRISSKSNTIMVVNVGTTLIPNKASSASSSNVLLLALVTIASELLRRNMR